MSGYSEGGASVTKKTLKTWHPLHYSAKSDIDKNLRTLQNRAYDLATNSALGSAAINTLATGVIGSGLKLFPRVDAQALGISSEQARSWSRTVKREFELWANQCDYLRRNTFAELQAIAFTSYLIDGDCFCLLKRDKPAPYTLRLQLVEAGRVSNPNSGSVVEVRGENGNRIINGIEVDSEGRLEAVWISNRRWDEFDSLDASLKWSRVKFFGEETGLRNVLHICKDVRPEQYRGVPLLAPVIESLKQVSRYADAELTSSIIRSFFSVFFVQPENNHDLNEITGEELDVSEYRLGAGTISALPRGVDVKAIDSSKQNAFDAFITNFIKQIGAAINIPFEVLLKNFQSSYSASRAALLQADNTFRQRRAAFVTDFCQPIYEQFLMEAVATGRIDAPGFDDPIKKAAWSKAAWYSESNKILDPLRETQAMILRLQNGLSTYEKEIAESSGMDYWDLITTLQQERDGTLLVLPRQKSGGIHDGRPPQAGDS